ncbi:MAG: type II secretion system secretin GspD [Deltaproteobacteria bacterium]|nr:type II secretion system secretin GspD [Deltaproteobacteria bacterium]
MVRFLRAAVVGSLCLVAGLIPVWAAVAAGEHPGASALLAQADPEAPGGAPPADASEEPPPPEAIGPAPVEPVPAEAPEATPPIAEPLGPSAPPAPARPSARPARQAPAPTARKVAMNFRDAELEAVVKFISELMGMNFILDDKVKGRITVISPTQVTVDEAYQVFQAILVVKGFTIVPAGKVFKIVPTREAKSSNIETVGDTAASPGDRFVTRILPLKYVPVENVAGILAPLVSTGTGSLVPYAPTNTLILTDSYSNIERLAEILQALDVETVDTVMEIVQIKYASADTLAKSLAQAVAEKSQSRSSRRAPTRGAPGVPAAAAAQAAGPGAKIISDTRTNSLILIADPQSMDEIKAMIRALDVEIPKGTGKINVYYLKYADAENVSAVLTAISKTATGKPKPGQPGVPAAVTAAKVGGEISVEFEEPVQITADKATNSLVIIATPQDYELLKTVIAKLDIRRPQVLVEAMILEMSYKKSLELGVEWRTTNDPTGSGTTVIAGSNFGNISTLMTNPLAVPAGLFVGAVDGTITFGGQTFLNIGALVRALQGTDDINVLSTPHLLTTDNEEAEIIVSDNIPFQTSQKFDNNGNPIFTFDYKDVGLTLRLTPQINDDNYVKLKLYQEISQLLSATTGTSSNAPSTSKRSAKTTVVVKDAATIVIGGLIKDNTLRNTSSIPCLGDLPLLGYLFRTTTDTKQKTNLLIFLTPHIIKSTEDLEAVSRGKRREFEDNVRNPDTGPTEAADKLQKYLDRQMEPAGTKP